MIHEDTMTVSYTHLDVYKRQWHQYAEGDVRILEAERGIQSAFHDCRF